LRIVTEGAPDLVDAVMDSVLEVDEGIVAPELSLDLFPADDHSRTTGEKGEDLERLGWELDRAVVFEKLAASRIQREASETEQLLPGRLLAHMPPPRSDARNS
jgi:hypothetical protein